MCCIFTCCGWMIDLVQRLWTFTMSCCISSAICCVLITASMSGIALGYNYSLAEYIDLKETNVSVFLKRGVFDEESTDEMQFRRAGGNMNKQMGGDNLVTGASAEDNSTPLRSGRRLDDSVFEAEDQNKYEGSLMKLTAKPPFQSTEPPRVTDDLQIEAVRTKYPSGSLDQLKAIQSLLDSRRAMINAGTTLTPIATYNFDGRQPYFPMYANPGEREISGRRMMQNGPMANEQFPGFNPARLAVPDQSIGSPNNWVIPKKPELFNKDSMPDYFVLSPTYPSPLTYNLGTIRLTVTTTSIPDGALIFPSRKMPLASTEARHEPIVLTKLRKEPEELNEKNLLEGQEPKQDLKKVIKMSKSSEEEYEDEIKGLPVRRRRSLQVAKADDLNILRKTNSEYITIQDNTYGTISHPVKSDLIRREQKAEATANHTNYIDITPNNIKSYKINRLTDTGSQSDARYGNDSHIYVQVQINKRKANTKSNKDNVDTTSKLNIDNVNDNKRKYSLLSRITSGIANSAKKRKNARRKSLRSKIVSSKYVPNSERQNFIDTIKMTFITQEILESIRGNLNEAGLLKNPATPSIVKLFQSTFA